MRLTQAASLLASVGLAAMMSGTSPDTAAAKNRKDGKSDGIVLARPEGRPVIAIISLNQQRVTVYDADGAILQSPVSTGQTGYETPAGIYTVLEKKAEHYSNLYDDAAMPFMQRLTWSGIALHAGVLPGYPASHGCIRMPHGFAERLFERTRLGMRVIVVRDDIAPAELTHPALFRPLPADDEGAARVTDVSTAPFPRPSARTVAAAKAAAAAAAARKAEEARIAARGATVEATRATKAMRRAEAVKARAESNLRQAEQIVVRDGSADERTKQARTIAENALAAAQAQLDLVKAEMQPKIDLVPQLRQMAKDAEVARAAAEEAAKEAARKLLPVSVFISRSTQRLYVRQAREPLFETPVSIANADAPLGTYVFTAVAYTDGEADLRWSVVSMYRSRNGAGPEAAGRRDGSRPVGAIPTDLSGAKLALDRIAIPKEAAERVAEIVTPGSSLIVSDEALSRETGKGTEFIVVMSHEPQGGIRIRRRTPEVRNRYQPPRPSYSGSPFGWSGRSFWLW